MPATPSPTTRPVTRRRTPGSATPPTGCSACSPRGRGLALRAAWEEFEAGESPEARFALAIDRLQPVLLNHRRGGGPWRDHGITMERVLARNQVIGHGSETLWSEAERRVRELAERGHFA